MHDRHGHIGAAVVINVKSELGAISAAKQLHNP